MERSLCKEASEHTRCYAAAPVGCMPRHGVRRERGGDGMIERLMAGVG
jgi:hypothetical protein